MEEIKDHKNEAEKWEDKVKKNEEHLKKLESEKKREQNKGGLGVTLWNSINTMLAGFDVDLSDLGSALVDLINAYIYRRVLQLHHPPAYKPPCTFGSSIDHNIDCIVVATPSDHTHYAYTCTLLMRMSMCR